MAMSRRMTDVEMEHYLKQVERRGKAKILPSSELEKWRSEYDKITAYLKEHYRNFVCSNIIHRNRYIDLDVFNRFVAEEEYGLIALTHQVLDEGNSEDFRLICWLMHLKYMAMWKTEKEESKA